jgi:hypothetical protein
MKDFRFLTARLTPDFQIAQSVHQQTRQNFEIVSAKIFERKQPLCKLSRYRQKICRFFAPQAKIVTVKM